MYNTEMIKMMFICTEILYIKLETQFIGNHYHDSVTLAAWRYFVRWAAASGATLDDIKAEY